MRLSDYEVTASIAVTDIDRARRFYEEALGLDVRFAGDDDVAFRCAGGTSLHVFSSPHAKAPDTTQAGWAVTGIEDLVAELRDRGVEFHEVHGAGIDTGDRGIADLGDGAKVAFFADPDGNILSIGEALGR